MDLSFKHKRDRLSVRLKAFDKLAVALSGGVDSALLLAEAQAALGDRLMAVTARSPIHPQQEIADAARIAETLGVRHLIIDSDAMNQADFLANTPQRCYICKKHVFGKLIRVVRENGFETLAHGANADDLRDYRPGLQAARELGVVAPLLDADFTKADIRRAARERGLSVWDKPAMACIATRFPYGTPLAVSRVAQVKAAEAVLVKEGFIGCRVRHHGDVARIEVPVDRLAALLADPRRSRIVAQLREIGFKHVSADLEGYVTGSLNRGIDASPSSG